MKRSIMMVFGLFSSLALSDAEVTAQKNALIEQLKVVHQLSNDRVDAVRKIYFDSNILSQGNPKISEHPITKEQCLENDKLKQFENPSFEKICKSKYMAPLYNPKNQKPEDAKSCIDQFEFPDIPCEYPVVWAKASEALQICDAMGKRLCDADEWENGCSGFAWDGMKYPVNPGKSQQDQRMEQNTKRPILWAYGDKEDQSKCATASAKSDGCDPALTSGIGVWESCGSNTYPSGSFPQCKSVLEVYDQHGNAAEHMNLALNPENATRVGGVGVTEMKGSWFIFKQIPAHKDDCYWRAPFWHGTKVNDPKSHANYHLGFRCCKSL